MGLFDYFWLKMKTGRSCCLGWLRPVAFVDPLLLRLALDDSSIICHYKLMIVMIVMICHSHQKPFTRIRCKLAHRGTATTAREWETMILMTRLGWSDHPGFFYLDFNVRN